MKIATWNVNSIKARLCHVKTWLDEQNPDMLLLQELKGTDFPEAAFTQMGYHCAVVPQKAYNGVAILSRHPMDIVLRCLPGDAADEQARYLEVDSAGLRVICLYAPNGNPVDSDKFPYKLAWLDRLKSRMTELRASEAPVVAGGDFNIIPEAEDCYDPAAWREDALFRLDSRRKWRALLNLGYSDALRVRNSRSRQYTYWDYQVGAWPKNNGIRIDHFLLAPAIADRLTACTIDSKPRGLEGASDHTPVIAEISP